MKQTNHHLHSVGMRLLAGLSLAVSVSGIPVVSYAQTAQAKQQTAAKSISGTIVDKLTGDPMIGVTIAIMQDGKVASGIVSDYDGNFKVNLPTGDFELKLSIIGFKAITLKPNQLKDKMRIEMEEDVATVGEVVVNGYFAKDKNTYTGAVTQISGAELKQISGTNIITAIAALTPGMTLVENNVQGSNPNQVPELVLRGMSSFSNEGQDVNQPTIILDGSEITMQDLYDLDMNEVESINVLKDASATALYGSKAANGVIVITRKPIHESTLRVAYNFTGNFQTPILSDYDLLNAADKLRYEQLAGLYDAKGAINSTTGLPEQYELDKLYNERYQRVRRGQDTDWLSQPARNSFSQDHSLRLYGGAHNLRYELSGRFANTEGVMKGDYRHRYNLGFKLDYFAKDNIKFSNRTTYSEISSKDSPYGSFSQYTQMNPYDPIYNEDGTLNTNLSWDMTNPLYEATLGSYSKDGTRTLSNTTDFRWDINKEFRLTAHFTLTSGTGWAETFLSPKSGQFKYETDATKKGSMANGNSTSLSYSGNAIAAYNKMFKHETLLSLNAGWEITYNKNKSSSISALGFYNDNLSFIGNAAGYPSGSKPYGTQSTSTSLGYFINGTFSWRNRYNVEGTYRITGSSLFGENNRFGHFWSMGAGWNIRNEKFMESIREHIDVFKLRGSMGFTGKVTFSPDQATTMYEYSNTLDYMNGIGAIPTTIGNIDLKWERTMSYNVGLEVSLFNRRLNIVVDAYLKKTQDLLLDKSKAPSTGVTTAVENIGELENKGLEFQVDGYIFRNNDFYWKLGMTGYMNRNKITKLNAALEEMNKENQENQDNSLAPLPQYAEGESVTALKLVRSAGIDPATGREIYIKRNGEYTFTYDPNDKVYIGDEEPSFSGTINNGLYYKGFTLYALFSFRCGAWIYNTTRVNKVEGSDPKYNADQRVFDDRWKEPGDIAFYKNIADDSTPEQTDRFAEEENTLTLTSLNIGYEVPKDFLSKFYLRNLRVGVNFTDLFRLSSVKQERGTSYLYSKGFELSLSATF